MKPGTHHGQLSATPPVGKGSTWWRQLGSLCHEATKDTARRHIAINAKDGSVLVRIPEGEFEMGDGEEFTCPKHVVELSEYWIGVHCVTNRQYVKFAEETGLGAPHVAAWDTPVWVRGRCPEKMLDHPVVYINWLNAQAYAEWAGLSLPSEAQWERAARGPLGLIYPWGNEWDEGKCRYEKNKGGETTAEVWGYPEGSSGYGTEQQSGNVWEWCLDWYDLGRPDYYAKNPRKDPLGPSDNPLGKEGGSYRVHRGVGWNGKAARVFRGAERSGNDPYARLGNQGLRLVRNSPSFDKASVDKP